MKQKRLIQCLALGLLLVVSGSELSLSAKTSEWKDLQGTSFRAEPVEILGPFALFKTSSGGGRRMLLRGMSPEDCLRFEAETAHRPARAKSWADAKGAATSELFGHVLQMQGKNLVPADLSALPEPELLLVLYGSHGDGEAWVMLNNLTAMHNRIQRVYPGLLSTVFMGVRHTAAEHRRMATQIWMPWLVADFPDEPGMTLLSRFAPEEGTNMVLLSRDGVPLLSGRATNNTEMGKFADQLVSLLAQINPDNPRTWKDRVQYLRPTRLHDHAQDSTGPLLVGNPLKPEGLRQRGVTRVAAKLEIAADGSVTPTLRQENSAVPEAFVTPLTNALRTAVVLPAIDHGVAVAGSLDYVLVVPPEDRLAEADAVWLSGEINADIPISEWLVLRPIKVPEQNFNSEVDHETANGTVVLKAREVTAAKVTHAAQMNAFNTDWFTAAGAASVQPKAGDKQRVDDTELTWQRVEAKDGFVDLQTGIKNLDYTVGYAWTEVEAPADMNVWLGIGSDDGIKIWVNGDLVHDKWIRRNSRLDDDIVPMHLKKGPNQILLKIQNAIGDWSFLYRLRARGR